MDMQKVKFIGEIDFSNLYFAPVETVKNRKSVNVYCNNKNTTWSNRIAFQLAEDEETPVIAKYNLDTPQDGEDPTRLNLTVLLNATTHKAAIDKLMDIDKIVKAEAFKKCREWWKKDLEEAAVGFKHKPLIVWDEARDAYAVKFKVLVQHPNPEPGKKYSKPSVIYRLTDDDQVVRSDSSILTEGSEITPSVSSVGVWFLGENQFGMSLKADVLLVKPKLVPNPIETLTLKRKYTEAAPTPGETSTGGTSKSAKSEEETAIVLEEGESAM